jgi:hypothetical protein
LGLRRVGHFYLREVVDLNKRASVVQASEVYLMMKVKNFINDRTIWAEDCFWEICNAILETRSTSWNFTLTTLVLFPPRPNLFWLSQAAYSEALSIKNLSCPARMHEQTTKNPKHATT